MRDKIEVFQPTEVPDLEVQLCRMGIEEVGANPDKLAAAIHAQLKSHSGRVPIDEIAHALDIREIRSEPLDNFEGAVLMTSTRSYGSILVNERSSARRQRFTIAHELRHFLNTCHKPRQDAGFWCEAQEVYRGPNAGHLSAYQRQEREANRFAASLLMPVTQLSGYLSMPADLDHVLAMADLFDVSKQAAAHRYIACRDGDAVIAISRNGKLIYWVKPDEFPRLQHWNGAQLPIEAKFSEVEAMAPRVEADPCDWLETSSDSASELTEQTFFQSNGYAMTLIELRQDEHDDEMEDGDKRGNRF